MTTNDISPYLQRPVRRLEDVMAEAEQQHLEPPAPAMVVVIPSKSEDTPSGPAVNKDRI